MIGLRPLSARSATGGLRTAAAYAAVLAAGAALFFFLHWMGNQLPYDLARKRLADAAALTAGAADERFFDAAKPLFTWEFCELSLMTLAGASRDGDERPITDAVLPETFRMTKSLPGGDTDRCAETRAVAVEGAGLLKAIKKTRYLYGNKAALAIGLWRLSVLDYHRLLLFAAYGAWALLAAALAALGWRALAVGAPIVALGIWLSGIAYFADAANGPAYIWAVLSAAILALIMRWRTTARRAPLFCFIAGMASAYLWFADGHNAIAIFLIGLAAWLGYSRLSADGKTRRAAGCVALWILGGAACFALTLGVKTAAAELSGDYYERNQEYYHDASVMGRFIAQVGGRLRQAWAETPAGDAGAPEFACPGCGDGRWRNLPVVRDVRGLWIMSPLSGAEDRALLAFSAAALAAAAGIAAWRARRGDRKPGEGVLWIAALTALASVQFFLPTDVDFRNARLAFVPLSACWVGLALAAAESERGSARALAVGVALLAAVGVALAHPAYAWALERGIAGERPAVRAEFDVYLNEEDGRLIYMREDCAESDVAPGFFLWVFPQDENDIPELRRESGFENMDFGGRFNLSRKDGWIPVSPRGGRCLFARGLPSYPIARIITGQRRLADGRDIWQAELAGDMRVPDVDPTARGGIFDIYKDGGRLIYAAQDCAESDARGRFFLSVFPAYADDLSDESKARGLDHDSLNFDFTRRGAVWGGECVAVVPLPRYEIDAIKTGQFIPDEGELWRAEIAGGAPVQDGEPAAGGARVPIPDGEPAARGGGFYIYMDGGKLTYAAQDCAEANTRARFFLSVFPARADDLSDESKAIGRDHDALNFDFAERGAVWGVSCAAEVALPRYEIGAVETGQFIPGGSELWRARLVVGD